MTQRKCGTCRYFEEGGIAASGWCRHPERQELQHMVLVRKTELACRDGWDHDLWEPREGGSGTNNNQRPARGDRAMVSEPAVSGSGQGTEAMGRGAGSSSGGQGGPPGDPEFSAATRRNEHPHHQRAPGSLLEPERSTFDAWSPTLDPGYESGGEPADEIQGETFSTRGFRLDTDWSTPWPESAEDSAPPAPTEPPSEVNDIQQAPRWDERDAIGESPEEPSTRFGAPRFGATENGRQDNRDYENGVYEPEPVEQSGLTEPFDVMESEDDMLDDAPGGSNGLRAPEVDEDDEIDPSEPAPEPRYDSEGASINVPMSLQHGQCCRTCRDFRPTDGGRHGWCNNPFAFEQRQQVDAKDLACQGTFGNWWSPTDDWWIERADISDHSTPTPLVDELIREIQDRKAGNRGSTEKPRRS